MFARLAAEAALGGLPPVTLLALLKHARFCGSAQRQERTCARSRRLELAILRGPRPRPGSAGLTQALATFRAELGKLKRGEPSDLHCSDPRTMLGDGDLDAAARVGRAIRRPRLRRSKH